MKIVFLWKPIEPALQYFKKQINSEATLIFTEKGDDLSVAAKNADVLLGWKAGKEILKAAPNLQLFVIPGAGVNRLLPALKAAKVSFPVVNSHGNSTITAQHAVALFYAANNCIVIHDRLMRSGKWRSRDSYGASAPLQGAKVGILGYGSIGREVHRQLGTSGVEFHLLKSRWETEPDRAYTYTPKKLHQFLHNIDHLIITLPLTPETNELIGIEELDMLGNQAVLINVGRGEVVVEKDLYIALKENIIKAAAIDVWYNYKPDEDATGRQFPYDHLFHELPNIILSPHRASSPDDYLPRWDDVIYNVNQVVSGERNFVNLVDLEKAY